MSALTANTTTTTTTTTPNTKLMIAAVFVGGAVCSFAAQSVFRTLKRRMKDVVPSLPENYTVPKVWQFQNQGGKMGDMNRPTAGARSQTALPRGKHALQLYSLGTPNGIKVTMLLEELGVDYDAWKINIFQLEQFGSEFVQANPNSKIPALLDYEFSPPIRVFESGNILKYIAEKHDRFIPSEHRMRTECYNWLFWQMASAPYIGGGFGHFYNYAPVKIEYCIDRYSMEVKREMDVLDQHLADKKYICGDEYTIADMAIFPWILCISKFYNASEFLDIPKYLHVHRWFESISSRDEVKRGCRVNGFGKDAVENRHSRSDFD